MRKKNIKKNCRKNNNIKTKSITKLKAEKQLKIFINTKTLNTHIVCSYTYTFMHIQVYTLLHYTLGKWRTKNDREQKKLEKRIAKINKITKTTIYNKKNNELFHGKSIVQK